MTTPTCYIDDVWGWDSTSPQGGDPVIDDNDGGPNGTGVGHGTWVSSILLANTDNGRQVAGFDHSAEILTVRSFNQATGTTLSHILGGLDYLLATSQQYNVVNMSWVDFTTQPGLEQSLDALEQAGALVVAGAGNSGGSTEQWYPASHSIAVTVSATDQLDTIASLSDTGPSVDFAAPGVDIYTASFTDQSGINGFHFGDGTSFSTPMVTGIASLGLSVRPGMTKDDLLYALKMTALDLGTPGKDNQFGWGRVNAHEALVILRDLVFFDDFETGELSRWSSSLP